MLSAAFDASGSKHDQPVLIVAGFVSTVDAWVDFDREWKSRLDKDGLDYFHANEFAQSSGSFADGWKNNEKRRRALLADLMGIIQSHAHQKVASIVVNSALNAKMDKGVRDSFYLEAYPLAGRTVAKKVADYARSFHAKHFPEFIFEDGDLDHGMLMTRFKKDGYPEPIFRPKRDTVDRKNPDLIKRGYRPLQAADLLAYELFLAYKQDAKGGVYFDNFRWAYKEFDKMPGTPGIYTEKDIARTSDMLKQKHQGNEIIQDPENGAYLLPRYNGYHD